MGDSGSTVARSVYQERIAGRAFLEIALARQRPVSEIIAEFRREADQRAADEAEALEEARALELARLDRALLALDPLLEKGDVTAVREARGLSESRRKLLGLDARADSGASGLPPVEVRFTFAPSAAGAAVDVRVAGPVGAAAADGGGPAPDPVGGDGNQDR
jgi:hypothetical protein